MARPRDTEQAEPQADEQPVSEYTPDDHPGFEDSGVHPDDHPFKVALVNGYYGQDADDLEEASKST